MKNEKTPAASTGAFAYVPLLVFREESALRAAEILQQEGSGVPADARACAHHVEGMEAALVFPERHLHPLRPEPVHKVHRLPPVPLTPKKYH